MSGIRCLYWIIALALGLAIVVPAQALDPRLALVQYKHDRWSIEDGAPPNIIAMAQTPDGFLWIGGSTGLFRFDGATFEPIPPVAGDDTRSRLITALFVDRGGTLWVGYAEGGVARWVDGALRPLAMPDPSRPVIGFAQTPDGAVWVVNSRVKQPLSRYKAGRWLAVGPGQGVEDQVISSLAVTPDGALWAAGWQGVLRLAPGSGRFAVVEQAPRSNRVLSLDRAGRLWMVDSFATRLLADRGRYLPAKTGSYAGYATIDHKAPRLIADRDGTLWTTDQEHGIVRLRLPTDGSHQFAADAIDRFGAANGLSSDSVSALLEGRDGELWAGTSNGLDRFRITPIVPVPAGSSDGSVSAFAGRNGDVFLVGRHALFRVRPGGQPERLSDRLDYFGAVCAAPDGTPWIQTSGALVHWTGSRLERYPLPPLLDTYSSYECIVEAPDRLLIAGGQAGFWRFDHGAWHQIDFPGIDFTTHWATNLKQDGAGTILARLSRRGLFAFDRGRAARFWDGKAIGGILQIGPSGDPMVIGGRSGIAIYRRGRITSFPSDRYPALAEVSAIARSAKDIWLMTAVGLVRLPIAGLERSLSSPNVPLPLVAYGLKDGLPALTMGIGAPILAAGGDGRLWLTTPDGVAVLSPEYRVGNTGAPATLIRTVSAEGRDYALSNKEVALPAGTSRLLVDYTAPALQRPDLLRFRYRLSGVDDSWIDAGARRQASYANLGPGDYRFEVQAAIGSSGWSPSPAAVAVHIPPTFVQSIWFKLLAGLVVTGLIVMAYLLRVRQATDRVRAALEARLAERERIARELHDTLLQGFQGLILRFQSIADRLPDEQPVRPLIDQALDRADTVMVEARNRVHLLRGKNAAGDLAAAITDTAAELLVDRSAAFELVVEGQPRPLDAAAHDDLLGIAQEAIRNAARHAQASRITASLVYLPRAFRFALTDDGVGIPEAIAATGERPGHFGLTGMRERAERLGAELQITSRPGAGTEVSFSLGGARAYPHERPAAKRSWRRFFRIGQTA